MADPRAAGGGLTGGARRSGVTGTPASWRGGRRLLRSAVPLAGRVGRRAAVLGSRLRRVVVGLIPPGARGALPRPVSDYKAPNYWLHYGFGFVRRGLPGHLAGRVLGGPPTYRQVETAAVGMSRAAALSVVPLAVQVGRRAAGPLPTTVATALLLLSPLTCSLLLHDIGRYDAIGVLVLALLALSRAAWLRLPLPLTAVLLSAAFTVATASEEFLLAVVAPSAMTVAGLLGHRHGLSRGATAVLAAGVLAPGAAVSAASLLLPAPREALLAARAAASRAGVAPAGAMGDSLAALDRGFVQNLGFFRMFEPRAVASAFLLWAGLYGGTTGVLGRLLGGGGAYRSMVSAHAVVAALLSASGVDFRRWWGLALLGLMSSLVLLEAPLPGEPATPAAVAGAAALALIGLRARDLPTHPWGRLHVDRAFR